MILKLYVENYRSVEKANLSFGQLNVLIGKNGAGKTTLISLINFIKNIALGKNINSTINEIAPYGDFFNANINSNVMRVEATVQTQQNNIYKYSFSIGFGPNKNNSDEDSGEGKYYFINESLSVLTEGVNNEENIFSRNANEDDFIRIESDNRRILQRVNNGISVLSSYAQKQVQEVASLLSEYSIIWMEQGSSISGSLQFANDLNLDTIDGIAVGLYLKDKQAYLDAMSIISEIIPGFITPSISRLPLGREENSDSNYAGFIVSWNDGQYAKNKTFSSGVLSGGNTRVIYLILSLYYSSAKTCFVAEEVENGMHLGRISTLMDKIKMIGKNRKIQIFLTTHNYLILDDLLPKEVILAKLGTNGSEYSRLSETSEYEDIRDELGREPTGKEMAESGLLFS